MRNLHHPIKEAVPLSECLTLKDRDFIVRGVEQGERNNEGYALLANLITTARYLESIGQPYEGNPRQLFEQFCQNCRPLIEPSEIETIWNSASKRATSPSLSEDAIENCIRAWKRKNPTRQTKQLSSEWIQNNGTQENISSSLHELSLREQVIKILLNYSEESRRKEALIELSRFQKCPLRELEQLAQIITEEAEQQDRRSDHTLDIDSLLKATEASVDVCSLLPSALADPLCQLAVWLNLKPEVYLELIS